MFRARHCDGINLAMLDIYSHTHARTHTHTHTHYYYNGFLITIGRHARAHTYTHTHTHTQCERRRKQRMPALCCGRMKNVDGCNRLLSLINQTTYKGQSQVNLTYFLQQQTPIFFCFRHATDDTNVDNPGSERERARARFLATIIYRAPGI
jgi:hypothetical protein